MANRRMIASDIWRDEFISELTYFERLLWIGLITTCADDQGRLQNKPRLIRADVFPLDEVDHVDIFTAIQDFQKAGRILLYEADGKDLVQILNWWTYQTPSWATASKYPAPEGWTDRVKIHKGASVFTLNWDKPGGFVDKPDLPKHLPKDLGNQPPYRLNDVKSNVNDESKVVEDERPPEPETPPEPEPTPAPPLPSGDWYIRVFSKVTDMMSIPGNELDKVLSALDAIYVKHNRSEAAVVEYLKPYWAGWLAKKGKAGMSYRRTNCAWLYDWAVAGEIPGTPTDQRNENAYSRSEEYLKSPEFAAEKARFQKMMKGEV